MLALAVAGLLTIGLAACGGNSTGPSSSSSTATAPESSSSPSTGDQGSSASSGKSSADEGSASFRTPGGDNSIQNYGEEASGEETDAASSALTVYLAARAKGDWARQCALLGKAAAAPLERFAASSSQFKDKGCAAILESLMGGAPASTRANPMTSGVASLRVEGDHGFALFHGSHGVDYFVSMVKEDGKWKVGAVAPSEFP
jgi:hypothetical protein